MLLQEGFEAAEPAVQAALHGPRGDAERLGDLIDGPVQVEPGDYDRALVDGEEVEGGGDGGVLDTLDVWWWAVLGHRFAPLDLSSPPAVASQVEGNLEDPSGRVARAEVVPAQVERSGS